jgi:hypothetical protein
MTYLEICQKAHQAVGLQGTMSSVLSSSQYQQTLAKFIADAWVDIQSMRKNWPFMLSSVNFSTTAGKYEYSLNDMTLTDLGRWKNDMIYSTNSSGERTYFRHIPYTEFLSDEIENQSNAAPSLYAVDPVDKHLYLNPPDAIYDITAHYYTVPVVLADNADVPLLPPAFHNLIVYLGGAYMASFLGQPNIFATLNNRADMMMGQMMRSELPARKANVVGIC